MGKYCSPSEIRRQRIERHRKKTRLAVLLASLLFFLTFATIGVAQEEQAPDAAPAASGGGGSQSRSGLGINIISAHQPQEEDLSDVGGDEDIDKWEIYLDWEWLRVGYNMTNGALDFNAYNTNWESRLKKNTTYAAYRLSSADGQSKWDFFALAGLAYTEATFSITSVSSHSSADLGYVVGGGTLYQIGRFGLGAEILIISTEGSFDGIQIATGSTQILSGLKLNF